MKVLHLSTADGRGGAAIAAARLCSALRGAGVDAQLLTLWPRDQNAVSLSMTPPVEDAVALGDALQAGYVDRRRSVLSDTLFSLETFQLPLRDLVEQHQPEIVHLHWVARFVASADLADFAELGLPVVWTLHDMWPFTGGCHYSAGCRGYVADCEACPQLSTDPARAVACQLDARAKAAAALGPRLIGVCPSRWIADAARSSTPLRKTPLEVIANGVDTTVYRPAPQAQARARLGLEVDARYIGFGAADLRERRKGFDELSAALERLSADRSPDQPPIRLVCFGHASGDVRVAGVSVVRLGNLTSESSLADAYRAVDAFALSSLEDNLPNTAIEAAACGTPVVAYRAGGIPEVVVDGRTGLLVDVGDRAGLAAAIARVTDDAALRATLGAEARDDACRRFALPRLASDHLALYRRLLAGKGRRTRKVSVPVPGLIAGVADVALPSSFAQIAHQLRQTAAELSAAIEWGRRADRQTEAERKRAEDAEAWAKQVEGRLQEQRLLEQSLRQWIATSEAAVAQAREESLEFKAWAERTEGLLATARAETKAAEEWARKADESRERERSEAAQLRQWAEDAERRAADSRALADDHRNWAERTEALLADARREALEATERSRAAHEQHEVDQAQILAARQWAERAEKQLAHANKLAEDNRNWAERTEALLRSARADAEQARDWARRADEERERDNALQQELSGWAQSAETKAAAAQRLAEEDRRWAEQTEEYLAQVRAELRGASELQQTLASECTRLTHVVAGLESSLAATRRDFLDAQDQLTAAHAQVAALEAEIEPLRRFAKTYRWIYVLHHAPTKT